MKITTTWEVSDIKPGVKVVDGAFGRLNGTVIKMPSPDRADGAIEPSMFAVVGQDSHMRTHLMTATQLAELLTKQNCTL